MFPGFYPFYPAGDSRGGGFRIRRPTRRAAGGDCTVARELRSGAVIRIWQDQFGPTPPFPIGPDALFIAFNAAAELGCFRALGWSMPARILDSARRIPRPHQRARATNRLQSARGAGLLRARRRQRRGEVEMQQALGNGTWHGKYTPAEVLDYCDSDTLGVGPPAAGDGAGDRLATCTVSRSIYRRCCRHRTQRHPD